MDPRTDRSHVRLAELVAALSLGIDLGFGQPMEHVLRQCLIALRIAERVGTPEEERAAIYYSALLINVGCHADAHEQAKWFGDDIALKSNKFASYDMRSLRSTLATMRQIGAGNQPLHRLRVALEFVVSGRRELDGMIETHNTFARTFADRAGPAGAPCGDAVATAYERWDGRGWPGELSAEQDPAGLARRAAGRACRGRPARGRDCRRLRTRTRAGRKAV